jgi:hypothetical protein
LENLDALFATLNNADMHFKLVSWSKFRDIRAQRVLIDEIGGLHESS